MDYLKAKWPDYAHNYLIHEQVMEKPYGWICFWEHRKVIEENNRRYKLAGNGPILVEKENGQVHQIGTAEPLDYYLSIIEAKISNTSQNE